MPQSGETISPHRIGELHERSLASAENQSLFHDVCIICAMREEGEAAIKVFLERYGVKFEPKFTLGKKRQYNYTTITNDAKEPLTIQVSWPAGNGPEEISLHTSHILNEFRPRFAGMSGICAGDPKKVKLGDLVVATKAFKYDSGKMVVGAEGQLEHLPDADTKGPDQGTLNFIANFNGWAKAADLLERPISRLQQRDWLLNALLNDLTPHIDDLDEQQLARFAPAWRDLVSELQQGESPELTSNLALRDKNRIRRLKFSPVIFPFLDPPKPTGYLAAMASGSMVRSDRPFKHVQRPVRTAWALEMEGYAFYRAVADHPGIRSLVVKGVCDYADPEKDDSYHGYASEISAIYMAEFIRVYVNKDLPMLPTRRRHLRRAPPMATVALRVRSICGG
jgi:nucleoside phosphorylase